MQIRSDIAEALLAGWGESVLVSWNLGSVDICMPNMESEHLLLNCSLKICVLYI